MNKTLLILSFLSVLLLLYQVNLFSAQNTELDELLNLSLEELSNIQVITASKVPQKIDTVPATVRVITAEQIDHNGYLTLEEALSDMPGMQFRNINSFNSYVFMRGVPCQNNLILVLIDGVQINELNSGGFYGGGQYILTNVERIEIVYGPASAVYGTNAMSGIINIITKSPQKSTGLNMHALYGSFNTINTDLSYGNWYKDKKLGWRISGKYFTTEKADLTGENGDFNWTDNLDNFEDDYAFDVKLVWHKLSFGLNYQNKQSSTATYHKATDTIYKDTESLWNIRFINSWLKHEKQWGKNLGVSSQIYYRNTTVLDNSVFDVTDTSQVGYYRPNNLIGLESLVNYSPVEKIQLVSGLVYENENLAQGYSKTTSSGPHIKPPKPPAPTMDNNSLFSIYGQFSYIILKSLEFYAGARFDNSSIYDQVLTPRMALVFNKKKWTSKLLYTEAFRAPKPWDYTDGKGNLELEPEEINSLEFYNSCNIFPTLRADFSVFHNSLNNLFGKETVGNSWRWINEGQVRTTGLEFTVEYNKHPLQAWFNYSLNHSINEDEIVIPEISKHQFNVGMQYKMTNKLRFSIRGNYIGERKNPYIIKTTGSDLIDAAFILNSAITYSLNKNFAVRFFCKNLLNTEYYHSSNLAPDRYRQPQRTLMLQLDYLLK